LKAEIRIISVFIW